MPLAENTTIIIKFRTYRVIGYSTIEVWLQCSLNAKSLKRKGILIQNTHFRAFAPLRLIEMKENQLTDSSDKF